MRGLIRFALPALLLAVLGASCAQPQRAAGTASAPAAGVRAVHRTLDSRDIAAIHSQMHALVDSQQFAGIVTLIQQHGRLVDLDAYGLADAGHGCGDAAGCGDGDRLDDQAGHGRGDDDAVRAGTVVAR